MPLAAIAGIGAIGSIGSALIGSNSASSAADKQMQAAQQAAQVQQQGSTNALNYQNGIYGQTQQNLNPYIGTGLAANSQIANLLGLSSSGAPGGMVQGAQGLNLNPNAATSTPNMGSVNSGLTAGGAPTGSPAMPTSPGSQLQLSGNPTMPQSGAVGAVPGMGSINAGLTGSPSIPHSGAVAGIQGGGVNGGLNSGLAQAGGSASGAGGSAAGAGGFGSLLQHYGQFTAPTDITEQNDPGYQARLRLGTDAIQRSAAARGGVLTGGTGKALDQFGQDYASNEYGNVYNRALGSYDTNYGVWNNDNNNTYSRLMGLSNSGQQAATNLGQFGQGSSNNVTQNLLGTGQQIGQDYGNAGAANASGIYNQGSALAGGVNGVTGNLQQLLWLKQFGGGPSSLSNLQSNQAAGNPGLYQSPTLNYGIG